MNAIPFASRLAVSRLFVVFFTAIFVFLVTGLSASAGLIVNGGFETPNLTAGSFVTISSGDPPPPGFGWTVSGGSVDVVNVPLLPFVDFGAFEGANVLDLNGLDRGTIYQDFATTPGVEYYLSFVYSDNPFEGGVSTANINVTDVGSGSSLLFDSISHSTANNGSFASGDGVPDYFSYLNTFTAAGTTTRLMFESTSASNSPSGGILLDAVSVYAVPEPGSLVFGIVGFIGFVAVAFSRKI